MSRFASQRHDSVPRVLHGNPGVGASASLCASFLVPNSGDFFPCRQFRVFPVRSACNRRPYRQRSPNPPPPGGMGPLPCCAARIGPQGSTRPGRLPPPGHSRSQPGAMPAMHQPDASALRAFTRHCHDAFFRAILSDSERANALIHAHWPKALRWMLTGEPARPIDPALVHGNLRQLRANKVYLVGGTLDKPNAVAPIEHKSSSDPDTPEPVTAGLRGLLADRRGRRSRLSGFRPASAARGRVRRDLGWPGRTTGEREALAAGLTGSSGSARGRSPGGFIWRRELRAWLCLRSPAEFRKSGAFLRAG